MLLCGEAISSAKRGSQRPRDLPAHVMVYYVIALALYMGVSYREVLRCLLEGVEWLMGSEVSVKVAGTPGISQARTRLGSEPLQRLHDRLVEPVAVKKTNGAWYRKWRLVSLDGSTMAVADTQANEQAWGRPVTTMPAPALPCSTMCPRALRDYRSGLCCPRSGEYARNSAAIKRNFCPTGATKTWYRFVLRAVT